MIAEAIIRKDGLFIKGFKPDKQGKRITVRIEQLPEQSTPSSCRGILHKYAKKELVSREESAVCCCVTSVSVAAGPPST